MVVVGVVLVSRFRRQRIDERQRGVQNVAWQVGVNIGLLVNVGRWTGVVATRLQIGALDN